MLQQVQTEFPLCSEELGKESLAKPIYLIWSRSLDSSVVPKYYKVSYIAPLHKKESHAVPANYRPVSLMQYLPRYQDLYGL